jgi:hypothetical protein
VWCDLQIKVCKKVFNLYTVHFSYIYIYTHTHTVSQQMHCSDSLLITYILLLHVLNYVHHHQGAFVCVMLSYIKVHMAV